MASPIAELTASIRMDVANAMSSLRNLRQQGTRDAGEIEGSFQRAGNSINRAMSIARGGIAGLGVSQAARGVAALIDRQTEIREAQESARIGASQLLLGASQQRQRERRQFIGQGAAGLENILEERNELIRNIRAEEEDAIRRRTTGFISTLALGAREGVFNLTEGRIGVSAAERIQQIRTEEEEARRGEIRAAAANARQGRENLFLDLERTFDPFSADQRAAQNFADSYEVFRELRDEFGGRPSGPALGVQGNQP